MFIDDIKLLAKIKKTENPNTSNENIQSEYRDGIWHRNMCHANYEKRETTNDGRNWTNKSRKKNRLIGEKENYKYLKILEADTLKQA